MEREERERRVIWRGEESDMEREERERRVIWRGE